MYGTQAERAQILRIYAFENDVNMYGTQADRWQDPGAERLRMM